jgi:two-component system, OmpR family, phosphate regulon sensor histidine kinase PhoR
MASGKVPLFGKRSSVAEAARALSAELEALPAGQVPAELEELSRQLRTAGVGDGGDLLQEVLDALPEPAGVLGRDGRLQRTNFLLDALLGPGRSGGRTLLEATRSAELGELAARALTGGTDRKELTLPSLQKIVMASLAPLPGQRALVLLRDLTETKRADSMRRDFVANASHELRTPVAAISGAVETLLGGGITLDPAARSFIEMIERHAGRLTRLTQDLLDLSRLESGEWRVELGAVEVAPLYDTVLELVRARAAQRKVTVVADAPQKLRVMADRRALEQILVNLLDNAIKFSPESGRVTVLADGAGSHIVISVIDQGIGIEPRHLQRIFERFYRVDSGRAREAGGTGLGLAIVKHLTQAQGGEVGVESGAGGSRFWVRLRAAANAP